MCLEEEQELGKISDKVPPHLKEIFELSRVNYHNPGMRTIREFRSDFFRFRLIAKLLRRYKNEGELKCQLALNHIVMMSNVFGVELTVKILFLACDELYHPAIKSMLVHLEYIKTDRQFEISHGINIIPLDDYIVEELRKINSLEFRNE